MLDFNDFNHTINKCERCGKKKKVAWIWERTNSDFELALVVCKECIVGGYDA